MKPSSECKSCKVSWTAPVASCPECGLAGWMLDASNYILDERLEAADRLKIVGALIRVNRTSRSEIGEIERLSRLCDQEKELADSEGRRAEELQDALLPLAALGGPDDGCAAAFHDLPADVVVYENSGRAITVGDVRRARGLVSNYVQHASRSATATHPVVDGDLATQRALALFTNERAELERLRSQPYYWAKNNGAILEDSDRYRWFRDDCDRERQEEIIEAADGKADMLDHHIDKGRCGL